MCVCACVCVCVCPICMEMIRAIQEKVNEGKENDDTCSNWAVGESRNTPSEQVNCGHVDT